jgi:hypothetical protein
MTSKKKKAAARRTAAKTPAALPRRTAVEDISVEEQIVGAPLLGKVRSYGARERAMTLVLEEALTVGDALRVKSRKTDLTQRVERMTVDGRTVQNALPGETVLVEVADRVRAGDAVYKVRAA